MEYFNIKITSIDKDSDDIVTLNNNLRFYNIYDKPLSITRLKNIRFSDI